MNHELKTLPVFFKEILSGNKTAEMRRDDKCFQKGDIVTLREYDPKKHALTDCCYTGQEILVEITHVLHGEEWGIKDGYAMLSFKKISGEEEGA